MESSGSSARRNGVPFWSSRQAQGFLLIAALMLIESLPVEAWLIVFAGVERAGVARVAVPLWYLIALVAIGWGVAWRCERFGMERILLVSAPIVVIGVALLLRISPSAYGGTPLALGGSGTGLLDPLVADAGHGLRRFTSDVGLTAIVVYVWWRGLLLGATPPAFDDVARRFVGSLGAVLLALVGLTLTHGHGQGAASLAGAMAVLVPLEVFAGLTAAAMANVAYARQRSRAIQTAATETRWVGSAVLLAGLVTGVALALSVFINFESVSALLRQLGPVGEALDAAARWVAGGVARVLAFLLLEPLRLFFTWIQSLGNGGMTPYGMQPCPAGSTDPACTRAQPSRQALDVLTYIQHGLALAIQAAIVVCMLALCVMVLRRLLERQSGEVGMLVYEEREALERRGGLRDQLRGLLRRQQRSAAAVEQLAASTMRALFRDVLRAAARAGVGREASETADEYAERLGGSGALVGSEVGAGDVRVLSEAYGAARYAEREPAGEEWADLRRRGGRVIEHLRRYAGGEHGG